MKLEHLLVILFALSLVLPIGSVFGSSLMWNQIYESSQHEVAHWVIETSDNGYVIGGYTREVTEGEENKAFLLVKTDLAGIMEWNQTYELKKYDSVGSVIETSDGGYAIAGGLYDCWLIKTDSIGNIQWNKTYGSAKAKFLIETSDGGYAFCGSNQLIKTDSLGNLEWTRKYGGNAFANLFSLTTTSDGGFALAGNFFSLNSTHPDFWLIKTNSFGNIEWSQTYEYSTRCWESAYFVDETADGGYVIAGTANFAPPLPISHFWLVKTDASGNMEWNKKYGESKYEQANSVVLTSDGGFAISGSKQFFDHGYHHDIWLIKTDANGTEEWTQTYGCSDNEIAHSLIETSDGGYAIAGEFYPLFGEGNSDFLLIKTDEMGNIPEFTSWAVLPLVVAAIVAAVGYGKKLSKSNKRGMGLTEITGTNIQVTTLKATE